MKKYHHSPPASEITIFAGSSVLFLCKKAERILSDGKTSVKFLPNFCKQEHLVMSSEIPRLGSPWAEWSLVGGCKSGAVSWVCSRTKLIGKKQNKTLLRSTVP